MKYKVTLTTLVLISVVLLFSLEHFGLSLGRTLMLSKAANQSSEATTINPTFIDEFELPTANKVNPTFAEPYATANPRDSSRVIMVTQYNVLEDPEGILFAHFLKHYIERLGISPENFCLTLHYYNEEDNPVSPSLQGLISRYRLSIFRVLRGPFDGRVKFNTAHSCLRSKFVQHHDWVLRTDTDELQVYGNMTLPELIKDCERLGVVAVYGLMKDHVSLSGELAPVQRDTEIWSQYPYMCDITKRVSHAQNNKVLLHKGHLRPSGGGNHQLSSKGPQRFGREGTYPVQFFTHHFKWNSFVGEEMHRRIATGYEYSGEVSQIIQHLNRHKGKFCTSCLSTNCTLYTPETIGKKRLAVKT
eukprot:TRINITY_DN397_c0_g1_i3.p1 TRINITY_DN397_c0_g1~~TRINITY_DN397_c0_g1_i3.p1  ORF type:complete len:359 (-),score=74.15 TRINITY_DN397_c0_g1_i3:35-1111(-)